METVDLGKECPLFKKQCFKELCAWYDAVNENCCILSIAKNLSNIETSMPVG